MAYCVLLLQTKIELWYYYGFIYLVATKFRTKKTNKTIKQCCESFFIAMRTFLLLREFIYYCKNLFTAVRIFFTVVEIFIPKVKMVCKPGPVPRIAIKMFIGSLRV